MLLLLALNCSIRLTFSYEVFMLAISKGFWQDKYFFCNRETCVLFHVVCNVKDTLFASP